MGKKKAAESRPTTANGTARETEPKRRGKASKTVPSAETKAEDPPDYSPGNSQTPTGRLASQIEESPVKWLVEGVIPKGMLAFIVGMPGTGKSTMGAWLCSLANRPAILPGSEESISSSLVPRLRAAGCRLDRTLILDGRLWSLPHDRRALLGALASHRADFLWIDPIDSYVGECSENDGQGVRSALESLSWIAESAGVTVVAARHPGKQAGNVCPGSRQWRAVPRALVSLTLSEGPPIRRALRVLRDPGGLSPPPLAYDLVGDPGKPKVFRLTKPLSQADIEGMDVTDSVERWKIDQAEQLVQALLADAEQEASFVYATADREKINDRQCRRAAVRLGVVYRREGSGREHKSYWSLPEVSKAHENGTPVTPDN